MWHSAVAAGLGVLAMTLPGMAADSAAQAGATTDRPAAVAAQPQPMAFPAGFEIKNVHAEGSVKTGLAKLTERAMTKGDFNKFLAELATEDKERAREFKGADQAKLDGLIDQIQKDWKAKYGEEFSIKDKVFDQGIAIVQGEVSDPAVALNNWPVPAVTGDAVPAAVRLNASEEKKAEKDAKLTKGRNVAIVHFIGAKNTPELAVSMLHELPTFYRVDIPNDRTGEQIYNDLVTHLTHLRDTKDQWPANIDDAYRAVAHCATASVYGLPVAASKG